MKDLNFSLDKNLKKSLITILKEEGYSPTFYKLFIKVIFIFIAVFSIWASIVEVDEVSIAPGVIIPNIRVKKLQHPNGGVIREILVKNGQHVKKGDPLLVLDKDLLLSQYKESELKLKALRAKKEYLEEQLRIKEELVKKGLNAKLSLLKLKSEYSDFLLSLTQNEQVFERNKIILADHIIKAPVEGKVNNMDIYTQGAVIGPADILMEIIPKEAILKAEIDISGQDIGHINKGQNVIIKLDTYDYGRFGGIKGTISHIAPSTTINKNQEPVYKAIIDLKKDHILYQGKVMPTIVGMQLKAEVITGSKSIIEYILKPIFTSADLALRER